jgi:hypothetical protein
MGYGIAAIIAIIAGVLAWLSTKSWRWANVVLVFLIVCAASTFGFLAAYTLKVHSAWRSRANEAVVKIEREETAKREKLDGILDENGQLQGGVRQMSQQVQDLIIRRGPAWFDAQREKTGPDGSSQVTIEAPEPHGVPTQSVVYVFDAVPVSEGGRYLGEFRVTEAGAGKTIKLEPNLTLTDRELKQLRASKGLWNIYLKMPADENDVLVALSDEQADALLPKDLDESYRKGTRTEAEMSDWVYLFHRFAMQRDLLKDQKVKLESNIARLEESTGSVNEKIEFRSKEKADLESDQQDFATELGAVTTYAKTLEAKSEQLAAELAAARMENAKLAAELKMLQLKAADRINQQTETAQATP